MAEINLGKVQEIQTCLSGIGNFVRNTIQQCDYQADFLESLSLYELVAFFSSFFTAENNKKYNCGELITQYIQAAPIRSSKFFETLGTTDTDWLNYFEQNIAPILNDVNILTNEDALASFLFAIFQWGQQTASRVNETELLKGRY